MRFCGSKPAVDEMSSDPVPVLQVSCEFAFFAQMDYNNCIENNSHGNKETYI